VYEQDTHDIPITRSKTRGSNDVERSKYEEEEEHFSSGSYANNVNEPDTVDRRKRRGSSRLIFAGAIIALIFGSFMFKTELIFTQTTKELQTSVVFMYSN
jgi:hypothetical protein